MTVLAFDPDRATIGVAWGSKDEIIGVDVIRVPSGGSAHLNTACAVNSWFTHHDLRHVEAVVVEGQQIYVKSHSKPADILLLGQLAGVLFGVVLSQPWARGMQAFFPEPFEWKQQQPKRVNQARSYSRLGWSYETRGAKAARMTSTGRRAADGYCAPTHLPSEVWRPKELGVGMWKHIGDAVGLCLWGQDMLRSESGLGRPSTS